MHNDLVELGWTEEHWSRITSAVTEEAQKARVAAQLFPIVGNVDPDEEAVPRYQLGTQPNPVGVPARIAARRLSVNSTPDLSLTTISVNVSLRSREAEDPDLNAALTMFRRAANQIARIEDALLFNGRPGPNLNPVFGLAGIPPVFRVRGAGNPDGLLAFGAGFGARSLINVAAAPPLPVFGAVPQIGDQVVTSIVQAITALEAAGQVGPFACALSPFLFEAVCTPTPNLVLPRDRILPFLQGPLVRSSAILQGPIAYGVVVSSSANPIELVVASDVHVSYLQTSEEPRLIFRVSERVALRIKDTAAIAMLMY